MAFADQVRTVRALLEETGRDPATFPIAKRIYIAVDDDAGRARERVSGALHDLYGYFGLPDLTPVAVLGTPGDCRQGVRDVIAAGAELVLLNPLFDDAEQMDRLATEVVPELG